MGEEERQRAAGLWFKGKSRGIKRRIRVFRGRKWLCTKVGTIFKNPVFMLVCRHGNVNCRVSERWRKEKEEGKLFDGSRSFQKKQLIFRWKCGRIIKEFFCFGIVQGNNFL